MLSIHPGHSVEYLTREVATGRENYYTGAVTEGEPPGRWYGAGAEALGLSGLVDHQDMHALYERFLEDRDREGVWHPHKGMDAVPRSGNSFAWPSYPLEPTLEGDARWSDFTFRLGLIARLAGRPIEIV